MGFQLVFERRFSMAHRLISGCSERCATPHGHNEWVKVTLGAEGRALDHKANMVAPFAEAKRLWHRFIDEHLDHAFQLSDSDPLLTFFQQYEPHRLNRIVVTPGDPTTEMMCACLMAKLDAFLSSQTLPLQCIALQLQETPTNTVILQGHRAYQDHLPSGEGWWWRADMSINDLS